MMKMMMMKMMMMLMMLMMRMMMMIMMKMMMRRRRRRRRIMQVCHWTFAKITENLRVRAVSQKMNTKRDRKFRKRKMK